MIRSFGRVHATFVALSAALTSCTLPGQRLVVLYVNGLALDGAWRGRNATMGGVGSSSLMRVAGALALILFGLTSCDGLIVPSTPSYTALRVTVERAWLTTGDSTVVTTELIDSQGRATEGLPVWAKPVVTTSDAGILKVRNGHVVAVGSGLVEVIAQVGELSGRTDVRVNPRTLSIEATSVVVNQAVQGVEGAMPLIAGRPGLLQAFVTADKANFFELPVVRVRVFQGMEEVLVRDVRPVSDGTGVPSPPLEEGVSTSWNVALPGALMRPGLGVLLELDPEDALPHTEPNRQRVFPTSGEPLRFEFTGVPPFRIRFVPIHRPGVGTGNVTLANVDDYLAPTRRVYPLDEIDRDIRAPFTSQTEGENWISFLNEISMLRVADGSSRYYYGIAKGTSGRAFLGSPAAVSYDMDLRDAAWVVAHELGHNFGRLHAGPCRPSDPWLDPNYPYSYGTIGVYGYDPETAHLFTGNKGFDIMGQCSTPYWVSDYTYGAVFEFRKREAARVAQVQLRAAAPSGRVPTLLVWGSMSERGMRLEPAFEIETVPRPPSAEGAYTLEGRDETGALLFSYSFEPTQVAHASHHDRSFAFAIPLDFAVERLAVIRVSGEGRGAEVRSAQGPRTRVQLRASPSPIAGERAVRRAAGEVEVRWDAAHYGAALVLNPSTGEVLTVARSGVARVYSDGPDLELRLSDGVSSITRKLWVR